MGDKQPVYVEISATLSEKLEMRIDEMGVTKREYFEEIVREDTKHITLDDPSAELSEVEKQLQAAHDRLEEVRDEKADVREKIKGLQQKKSELEKQTEESGIITAASYDEAIDALIDRAVADGIAETGTDVERVAEEWGRDPRIVCRDVFERDVRVLPEDVSLKGHIRKGEVPDEWETSWPDYAEAIEAFAGRLLSAGVIYDGHVLPHTLSTVYEQDFFEVAADLIDAVTVDTIEVVDRDVGESLAPSDAPEADLVVGETLAKEVGLENT